MLLALLADAAPASPDASSSWTVWLTSYGLGGAVVFWLLRYHIPRLTQLFESSLTRVTAVFEANTQKHLEASQAREQILLQKLDEKDRQLIDALRGSNSK